MENEVISLQEALKIISLRDREGKPFPFDLAYRTFNSQTKQGGKLKIYKGCRYLPEANASTFPSLSPFAVFNDTKSSKNPEHFKNRTRNIEVAPEHFRKIRIDFIDSINNKKVIY